MQEKLKGAGKAVQYIEFPGLDHQLDSTEARTRLLMESDQFLRKAMGL
jgi:dipeptidyl aminopeptidase/acylaminoacyl peptidase